MTTHTIYQDEKGWTYRVMGGLGGDVFKARYRKPGTSSWKCMAKTPWRKSLDEAQDDLDAMARAKGWTPI